MKVIVLGAGLVGGPMALDLAADDRFEVSVADIHQESLDRVAAAAAVTPLREDLSRPGIVTTLVRGHDLVVDAMPGFLGYQTLRAVIAAGCNVVDIAFFPEDPFELDEMAKAQGVVAVMDCGVFPGMGSALIGRVARRLDRLDRVLTYVGGLPQVREQPWEYKAVFSPVDVIEEYTRPARFLVDGELVTRPALSDIELIEFEGLGHLEAFNTDGLRTLMRTVDAPNMKEKTLRYPGHAQKMQLLRDAGFFGEQTVRVAGQSVRPLDVTAELLFPQWQLQPGEGDLTVLQIQVDGVQDGRRTRYRYDLLDYFDTESGTTSMARTTGYTATMTVRLIADGLYDRIGISPPEYLGQVPGCVPYLLAGLAERGVHYREKIDTPGDL